MPTAAENLTVTPLHSTHELWALADFTRALLVAGLDSHAALAMVRHLIGLTRLGHTVACSIHQPRQDIFNAFDAIMILSEGHLVRKAASCTTRLPGC